MIFQILLFHKSCQNIIVSICDQKNYLYQNVQKNRPISQTWQTKYEMPRYEFCYAIN